MVLLFCFIWIRCSIPGLLPATILLCECITMLVLLVIPLPGTVVGAVVAEDGESKDKFGADSWESFVIVPLVTFISKPLSRVTKELVVIGDVVNGGATSARLGEGIINCCCWR